MLSSARHQAVGFIISPTVIITLCSSTRPPTTTPPGETLTVSSSTESTTDSTREFATVSTWSGCSGGDGSRLDTAEGRKYRLNEFMADKAPDIGKVIGECSVNMKPGLTEIRLTARSFNWPSNSWLNSKRSASRLLE